MLSEERKEIVLALTRALIGEKSVSGEEKGAAGVLRGFLAAEGFDEVKTDRYGNVIGLIHGKRPGPTLLFDGHIDTVPVGHPEAWRHDPYAGEIENGRLYGRGTSDMKGAVAAYSAAAVFFAQDSKRDFAGTLAVDGIVHEECFEGVAARAVSAALRPDYVIIGEASDCDVKIGQRGRAEVVLETFGVPAHSANPEKGVNAVYAMCACIAAFRAVKSVEHPILGRGILELTDIKSEPYPGASVVPAYCRATFDRRLLPGETRESVLAPLRAALGALEKTQGIRAKVSFAQGCERCYTGEEISGERFFPGWLCDENSPWIRAVRDELGRSGLSQKVKTYSFCTNGSHYAGEAGIPTIGLGPSREDLAHTDDEYVELEELYKAAESYGAVMRALLK